LVKDNTLFNYNSNNEKQYAILEEKINQQYDQINMLKEKQKVKEEELMNNKTNYVFKINEIKNKYEQEISQLQIEIDNKNEKLTKIDYELRNNDNK